MTRERLLEHIFSKNLGVVLQPTKRFYKERPDDSLMGKGRPFKLDFNYEQNPDSLIELFPVPREDYCKLLKKEIQAYIVDDMELHLADIKSITLHYSLRVTADGGKGGLTYHANPCISGKKWYDDVIILDKGAETEEEEYKEDTENEQEEKHGEHEVVSNTKTFGAGRLISFVFISTPSHPEKQEHIMAFVHRFRNIKELQYGRINEEDYDVEHTKLSPCNAHIPFSCMKLSFKNNGRRKIPDVSLIDSESISSGVWTHQDYDHPGNFWFLRSWDQESCHAKEQAALFLATT